MLARFVPALIAFIFALFLLFSPTFVQNFPNSHTVEAAPLAQEEPTPTPIPVSEVAVALVSDEPVIETGGIISYTIVVTNTTDEAVSGMVVSATIPNSTTYLAGGDVPLLYEPETGVVTWNVGGVPTNTIFTTTFQVQANSSATDTLMLAEVVADSPTLAEELQNWEVNAIGDPDPNAAWLTPQGGTLSSEGLPIDVIVPSEGITEPLFFKISPAITPTLPTTIWSSFDLSATTKAGKQITSFPASLTIAIDLNAYITQTQAITSAPSIYWYNETTSLWEAITSYTEWRTNRVTAAVNHFSTFGIGNPGLATGSYGAQHLPTINGFTNDEWSGNSSAGYNFILPPAPRNMPFNLGLGYSSEGVNSLRLGESDTYDDADMLPRYSRQASTVGWGWALSGLGAITRDLSGANGAVYLSFGGGRFELKQDGTSNRWFTEPQSFMTIVSNSANRQYATKWTVYSQDGMRYTFGSEGWGNGVAYNRSLTVNCTNTQEVLREAHLTEIRDAVSNTISISYATELRDSCNDNPATVRYVRAIRPTEILYRAYNVSQPTAQILLEYDDNWRLDAGTEVWKATDQLVQTLWSTRNLVRVKANTWADMDGNGSFEWTPFRRYKLVQDQRDVDNTGAPLLLLRKVEDYGSQEVTGTPLPAYTFEYSRLDSRWRNTNVLVWGRNGYGGDVFYHYVNVPVRITECDENNTDRYAERYAVDYMQVYDGQGNVTKTTFTSTDPFMVGYRANEYCRQGFEFGGYGNVVSTVMRGSTSYQKVERFYHTSRLDGAEYRVSEAAGLLKQSKVIDPMQGDAVLEQTRISYTLESISGINWVRKLSDTVATTGVSGTVSYRREYDYQIGYQRGRQYGRVTQLREYANGTEVRRTETRYITDTVSGLLLVLPYQEQLLVGGTCKGETRYSYDNLGWNSGPVHGLLTRSEIASASNACADFLSTYQTYTAQGNVQTITDARGGVTNIAYDTVLYVYPTVVDQPNVNGYRPTLQYTWNYANGQVTQELDVDNGVHSDYTYDTWGRLIDAFTPINGYTRYTYNDTSGFTLPYQVVQATRTNVGSPQQWTYQRYFYNGLGQEIETKVSYINPSGQAKHTITYAFYSPLGGVDKTYTPIEYTATTSYIPPSAWGGSPTYTQITYDALARPLSERATDGTMTYHTYSTRVLDSVVMNSHFLNVANQNRVLYYTDALGRMRGVEERNASNGTYATTRYTYDGSDRLTQVLDNASNQTTIQYDYAGRKTAMDDPDMGAWAYRYDRVGNLRAQLDAEQNGICFTYDLLGRPNHKYVYDGISDISTLYNAANPDAACPTAGVSVTEHVTNTYDAGSYGKGRLYAVQDLSGDMTTYSYDARGRVTSESKRIRYLNTNYTFLTSYDYDVLDRLRKVTYPSDTSNGNGSGDKVYYNYDSVQQIQLTNVTLVSGGVTTTLASGMTYNPYGQLKNMTYGTTPNLSQVYNYYPLTTPNGVGRLQSVQTGGLWTLNYTYDTIGNVLSIASQRGSESQTQNFSYDFLNRLMSASTSGSSNGQYSETYAYNQLGNMTAKAGVNYTYPTGTNPDRPHAVTSLSNGNAYTYDNVGNMVSRTVGGDKTEYVYDNENRLVRVQQSESVNYYGDYAYDGQGNRVYTYLNGGERTLYPNKYVEFRLNGAGPTGSFIKYYFVGDQRLAMKDTSGTLRFFLNDHLGSTSLTLDSNGATYSEQRYKPYGESRYSTATTTPTQYRFTGQMEDLGTGLYYYNARFYDPTLGRFVQSDPIVPNVLNSQALNAYSYTLNNPIKFSDPSGYFSEDEITTYLQSNYPDNWQDKLNAWKNDIFWWSALLAAGVGDTMGLYSGGAGADAITWYKFTGMGTGTWKGVEAVEGPVSIPGTDIDAGKLDSARIARKVILGVFTGSGGASDPLFNKWQHRGGQLDANGRPSGRIYGFTANVTQEEYDAGSLMLRGTGALVGGLTGTAVGGTLAWAFTGTGVGSILPELVKSVAEIVSGELTEDIMSNSVFGKPTGSVYLHGIYYDASGQQYFFGNWATPVGNSTGPTTYDWQ